MASRVAGAVLALTAAALLAVSVVASAWWQGHPKFNGAEIKAKEISVGPLGATGCNTGGDGACMSVPVDATFETVGFALAGVAGLLAVTALALAVFTLRAQPRRKSFAVLVIIGAMLAVLLALVLVAVGPKIRTEAPLPFSTGLFVFFGGIASALASSVFAMRAPSAQPQPRVQLAAPRSSRQSIPQMPAVPHAPQAGVDVQALLAQDALRPSSLGPEPMLGRGSPVQSPGGVLPGPPLGAIAGSGPQPLFSSAPQLRPLYDVAPGQGGTGGFVPQPPPPANFPLRPPTPIPRDQISAIAGIPTPASVGIPRPVTMAGVDVPPPPPEATDRDLLGVGRMKPKTLPPPMRGKTSSIVPPPPPPMAPPSGLVQPRPLPTLGPRPETEEPFDSMQTYQREGAPPGKAPAPVPAPMPAATPLPPMAAPTPPAPPMPAAPAPPPQQASAAKAAARTKAASIAARVAAMPPITSAASGAKPNATGARPVVPMPARPAPAAAQSTPAASPPMRLLTEDAALDTDVSMRPIGDDVPPIETFETATSESTNFAKKPEPPAEAETRASTEADDEAMTKGRDKVERTDMELPTVRPPTETSPSTELVPEAVAAAAPEPAKERPATKVPISTAPASLPPPTEKQAVASGPSPACPQCEAPMAWVEAHLRFYCKSCKMYF